jgi:hypothetical protein
LPPNQGELIRNRNAGPQRRRIVPLPDWYDELDAAPTSDSVSIDPRDRDKTSQDSADSSQTLAHCFLHVSRLGYGTFDLLTRYETALWRQAAQILFMLQSAARARVWSECKRHELALFRRTRIASASCRSAST